MQNQTQRQNQTLKESMAGRAAPQPQARPSAQPMPRPQFHPARNAIDTLRQVFDLFIKRDPTFAERFAGLPKHGRTRRYLARDAGELYRDRPDLGSVKLDSGWWMSTNHSRQTIGQIISMACDVAHVIHGLDLIDNLGD